MQFLCVSLSVVDPGFYLGNLNYLAMTYERLGDQEKYEATLRQMASAKADTDVDTEVGASCRLTHCVAFITLPLFSSLACFVGLERFATCDTLLFFFVIFCYIPLKMT